MVNGEPQLQFEVSVLTKTDGSPSFFRSDDLTGTAVQIQSFRKQMKELSGNIRPKSTLQAVLSLVDGHHEARLPVQTMTSPPLLALEEKRTSPIQLHDNIMALLTPIQSHLTSNLQPQRDPDETLWSDVPMQERLDQSDASRALPRFAEEEVSAVSSADKSNAATASTSGTMRGSRLPVSASEAPASSSHSLVTPIDLPMFPRNSKSGEARGITLGMSKLLPPAPNVSEVPGIEQLGLPRLVNTSSSRAVTIAQTIAQERLESPSTLLLAVPTMSEPKPLDWSSLHLPLLWSDLTRQISQSGRVTRYLKPLAGLRTLNIDLSDSWFLRLPENSTTSILDAHLDISTQSGELITAQTEPKIEVLSDPWLPFERLDAQATQSNLLQGDVFEGQEEPLTLRCQSWEHPLPAHDEADLQSEGDEPDGLPDWANWTTLDPRDDREDDRIVPTTNLPRPCTPVPSSSSLPIKQVAQSLPPSPPLQDFDTYTPPWLVAEALEDRTVEDAHQDFEPLNDHESLGCPSSGPVEAEYGASVIDQYEETIAAAREEDPQTFLEPTQSASRLANDLDDRQTDTHRPATPESLLTPGRTGRRRRSDEGADLDFERVVRTKRAELEGRSQTMTSTGPLVDSSEDTRQRDRAAPVTLFNDQTAEPTAPQSALAADPIPRYLVTLRGLQNRRILSCLRSQLNIVPLESDDTIDVDDLYDLIIDEAKAVILFKLSFLPMAMNLADNRRASASSSQQCKKDLVDGDLTDMLARAGMNEILVVLEGYAASSFSTTPRPLEETPVLRAAKKWLESWIDRANQSSSRRITVRTSSSPTDSVQCIGEFAAQKD